MFRSRTDRSISRTGAMTIAAFGALAIASVAHAGGQGSTGGQNGNYDPNAFDALQLHAIVRDFRPAHQNGGHPDFGVLPAGGMGHSMGNVADTLDADGKPVFQGGGAMVLSPYRNAKGETIHPSVFDVLAGDIAGLMAPGTDDGAIDSANSFRQWFRDVPTMNVTAPFPITLHKENGKFVFRDRLDTHMAQIQGGGNKNRNFTFEAEVKFQYQKGANDTLRFAGDDDIWVFIDGKLVVDVGGVHATTGQVVLLDRLDWLQDGETYDMKIFFAERYGTSSRLEIESSVVLLPGDLPGVYAQYD